MKIAEPIRLICVLTGLGVASLQAKDAADYQVGEIVGKDIVTPVALQVVDPEATAALKASEAAKIPAVFEYHVETTNAVAVQLNQAFESARSGFVSSLQETFHQKTVDDATVASADFGYLVTDFNVNHKDFPITTALAEEWAQGDTGYPVRNKLLWSLLGVMRCDIRPDELPNGFGAGDTVQLIPNGPNEEQAVLTGHAQITPKSSLMTLSQAQMQFRREFTAYDELLLARAASVWLKPNCLPNEDLTVRVRDRATARLIVAENYAAGQIIAPQGSVVDANLKLVLDQLQTRMAAGVVVGPPAPEVMASRPVTTVATEVLVQPTLQPAPKPAPKPALKPVLDPAPQPALVSFPIPNVAVAVQPVKAPYHFSRAVIELASISGLSALMVIGIGVWKLASRRRATLTAKITRDLEVQLPAALQTQLAPQLVQAVRDALVQELAGQRRELLVVQQNAAVEVTRLVRKMDEMQMELQERMQVYEQQIQRLEAELTARREENQELIKAKIEMIRQQRESETVEEHEGKEMAFN